MLILNNMILLSKNDTRDTKHDPFVLGFPQQD
jgi:hypothetical protein